MSDGVVNLRRFRKQRLRREKEEAAEANRIAHGRTKAEKQLTKALNLKERKALDHGRLETGDGSDDNRGGDPSGS